MSNAMRSAMCSALRPSDLEAIDMALTQTDVPPRTHPMFDVGSKFYLLMNLEISLMWISHDMWRSHYHNRRFVYGKADTERRKRLLQMHHDFLSGLKDIETDEGVVLTEEEVADYIGVEMPQ
jgi:hypothetical protein